MADRCWMPLQVPSMATGRAQTYSSPRPSLRSFAYPAHSKQKARNWKRPSASVHQESPKGSSEVRSIRPEFSSIQRTRSSKDSFESFFPVRLIEENSGRIERTSEE